MNLPLNERFTSVQKDDLKAALGKVVAEGEVLALSSFVAKALRDEMADDYNLTDEHVKRIVDTAAEAILEYGPETPGFATDEAVQAVEDFLCI